MNTSIVEGCEKCESCLNPLSVTALVELDDGPGIGPPWTEYLVNETPVTASCRADSCSRCCIGERTAHRPIRGVAEE